jgi:uncharacterized protein
MHKALLPLCVVLAGCASKTTDVPLPGADAASTACSPNNACALGEAPLGSIAEEAPSSVLGAPLMACGLEPITGFVRDGRCVTGSEDVGAHTVCGVVNDAFLQFSKARGNDLVTARGSFPGLVAGNHWCLCEGRVQEALAAGIKIPIVLAATHRRALRTLPMDVLKNLDADAE